MKLSLKIATQIGLGAVLLVLIMSLLSIRRDQQIVMQDLQRDAQLIATSVAVAAASLSPDEIARLTTQVSAESDGVTVRYLPEGALSEESGDLPQAVVPIRGSAGAIEVSESLEVLEQMMSRAVRSLIITAVFVLLLSVGGGSGWGGWWSAIESMRW